MSALTAVIYRHSSQAPLVGTWQERLNPMPALQCIISYCVVVCSHWVVFGLAIETLALTEAVQGVGTLLLKVSTP